MILAAPPPNVPQGSTQFAWMWWIPLLPLTASAICGLLHFMTLRARERANPRPKVAHGHGHDDHGEHAHAAHAEHHDAHGDHGDHGHEKVPAGIGGLAPVVAV